MLFRDQIAAERRWPRRRYVIATVSIIAALAALAVLFTYDHRLAAIFLASAALVFVALRLVAMLMMAVTMARSEQRTKTPLPLVRLICGVRNKMHLDGALVGVEVKASATVTERDVRGLKRLAALAGAQFRMGVILYDGEQTVPLGDRLWAAPVSTLWGV